MGRTGRKREGKIAILLTEGKEESTYLQSLKKKNNIYKIISNSQKHFQFYKQNPLMIPKNIKIKCHKMFIKVPDEKDETVNESKLSKSKKTSDDEYKMDEDEDVEEEDDDVIDDDFIDDGSDEEEKKPKKPKKTIISKKGLNKSQSTASPKGSKATNSPAPKAAALDSFAANSNEDSNGPVDITKYKHMNYEFLKDEKIKDINGNKKGDPDYDPRTLYVPPEFKKQCTPALRQWWELKSTNFDVLFFFKVGKFYELYHQDAVIAVKELGLSFMRGIL